MNKLKVLVVDDSAANREAITNAVNKTSIAQVIGTAIDAMTALKRVRELSPDVVTLDLAMPEMDGFSFLRVLMSTRPLPVIVVSSYDHKENALKALELGALDFVPKQGNEPTERFAALLEEKLRLAGAARSGRPSLPPARPGPSAEPAAQLYARTPRHVVAVTASTGGPGALLEVLSGLKARASYAVLIAQHMPPKFTSTFAERLNRFSSLWVTEARDGDLVTAGRAFVCPGDHCMELERTPEAQLRLRLCAPTPSERYVPNGTRLFTSVAAAVGIRAIGVVLTGMGDDGAQGAREIERRGGRVIVESEASAVVYGMPKAALEQVPTGSSVTLPDLAAHLNALFSATR